MTATMDKQAYRERKKEKEACFTGCFKDLLDGAGEGKEGKYVCYRVCEKETNDIYNSSILCREGKARINIGFRLTEQTFLVDFFS